MSCKPTYKGIRYNSLEELYKANKINKQQAIQLYAQYLDTNPQTERGSKQDIEGFKNYVENRNKIVNKYSEFHSDNIGVFKNDDGTQKYYNP